MAPQYKLTYFNFRGLAEPIRYIFAYLNIPYEDVRITPEEWVDLQKTTPYGKLPMLEIDGKVMSQSKAIARYLARQYNLTGNDEWDSSQCDVVVDVTSDLILELSQWHKTADEEKKKELEEKMKTETLPFYLKNLEKTIIQNGGHLVASKLTWTDFFVVSVITGLEEHFKGLCNNYPELKKLQEKIFNIPAIATWITKRPVTAF